MKSKNEILKEDIKWGLKTNKNPFWVANEMTIGYIHSKLNSFTYFRPADPFNDENFANSEKKINLLWKIITDIFGNNKNIRFLYRVYKGADSIFKRKLLYRTRLRI